MARSTVRTRSAGGRVRTRFVAFDMDGTLVNVESSWAAVHAHFGDRNEEGLRLFNEGRIDDREFVRSDVRIWHRYRPDLTLGELAAILDEVPLMPGATELFHALRAAGVTTAIVSGGIDLLAERIARELGIDHVRANGFETTAGDRITGEGVIRVPIHAKEEVLAALQGELGFDPGETAAVGNSEIDLGLFRRSRIGIAYRPEDDLVRRGATHVIEAGGLEQAIPILMDGTART